MLSGTQYMLQKNPRTCLPSLAFCVLIAFFTGIKGGIQKSDHTSDYGLVGSDCYGSTVTSHAL